MSILIIAEHDNHSLKKVTLNTVSAASQIGGDIHLLVAGHNCASVAEAATHVSGVSKVLRADQACYEHMLAENISVLVAELAPNYSHLLAPATTNGKNFMPRVAASLDVGQISDITSVEGADTFKRPIYAGNAIATVQSTDTLKVITVRASAFEAAEMEGSATIEPIDLPFDTGLSSFVGEELAQSDRPELTSAAVIVSGGRAMASSDNFDILYKLADKLGGAVGATRAAVDAGYVPNDMQIGQTGKIVAPDLYIAAGVSGAIQHLAGMKESKCIVAINKDEEAPIFQIADYGLVADLFEVIPELTEQL